ncbi:general secretion pathway protein GspK [Bradyrhizobium cenepequi]
MDAAARRPNSARDQGFALLVVIWIVGLISMIALTVITTSHYRVKTAVNAIEAAKAASLAEAGVTLAKLALTKRSSLSAARTSTNGPLPDLLKGRSPVFCVLPQGSVAAILIEDEGGKIDLNLASKELLSALLVGLGLSEPQANQIASNIAIFGRVSGGGRNNQDSAANVTEGRRFGPKYAPFETALELDQVEGISRELFEAMLPLVTVVSRRPGVDPQFAPPALLAALSRRAPQSVLSLARAPSTMNELTAQLANAPNDPVERSFTSPSSQSAFLIDAEVMTPGGGFFAREAIVEWQDANGGLLTREWRRGRGRYQRILAQQIQDSSPWPSC